MVVSKKRKCPTAESSLKSAEFQYFLVPDVAKVGPMFHFIAKNKKLIDNSVIYVPAVTNLYVKFVIMSIHCELSFQECSRLFNFLQSTGAELPEIVSKTILISAVKHGCLPLLAVWRLNGLILNTYCPFLTITADNVTSVVEVFGLHHIVNMQNSICDANWKNFETKFLQRPSKHKESPDHALRWITILGSYYDLSEDTSMNPTWVSQTLNLQFQKFTEYQIAETRLHLLLPVCLTSIVVNYLLPS
jgi:hypothetical protein